jgi:hypothetical protein
VIFRVLVSDEAVRDRCRGGGIRGGASGETPCEHAVSSTRAHAAEIDQAARNALRIHSFSAA